MLDLQNEISAEDNAKLIGREFEVLVEGPSKTALKHDSPGPRQLTGRSRTDHIVVFEGNERLIGRMIEVDIEETSALTLFGRVVTEERVGSDGAVPCVREARISLPVVI